MSVWSAYLALKKILLSLTPPLTPAPTGTNLGQTPRTRREGEKDTATLPVYIVDHTHARVSQREMDGNGNGRIDR